MKKEEFYYDSNCNTNKIHATKWVPEGTPLCIVQIVHGMAEHTGRYEEFAKFLTDRNIMVVGEDHLGHGLSMGDNPPGYFCDKEPAKVLVENVQILKDMIRAEYPNVPYIIFGHSMGSFITRNYIHTYGKEIDGAILSGTGILPKGLLLGMNALVDLIMKARGPYYVSNIVKCMAFGKYQKRIRSPKTKHDWLSTDEEQVRQFEKEPLCGFTFTLNGFKGLAELMLGLHDRKKMETIPKDFPLHFIFGDNDPVGDYGKSAYKSCLMYKSVGMVRVSNTVYPGKRHELLHEDIREEVMNELLSWINKEILK